MLGGGHVQGPVRNALIESAALALLAALAARQRETGFLPAEAKPPLLVFAALLIFLLLQVVPLPWPRLPGREATDAVVALLPDSRGWRPLSLDPSSTARFALSLSVPLATFLVTLVGGARGRLLAVGSIALLAGASALLGMVQLALGFPGWTSPFGLPDPGIADGLFVNRNHQAMFLLCGLIATGLWLRLDEPSSPLRIRVGRWRVHAAWLLVPLLTLMVVSAASKAGFGLLAIVLPMSIAIGMAKSNDSTAAVPSWALPLAALAVTVVIVAFIIPSATIDVIRARLIFQGDTRVEFFPDLVDLVKQLWPTGSGAGTFVPTYKAIEDLDRLGPPYLNHAHNEYLEWLIEMGLAGLILLVAGAATVVIRAVTVLQSTRSASRKWSAIGGFAMLAVLALHSAIDYPMRTDALAAVAGVALGLLFIPSLDTMEKLSEPSAGEQRWRLSPAAIGLILFALLLSGQAMRLRLAEAAAGDANAGLAAAIATHDGFARAYLAEATLDAGQPAAAREIALTAIRETPLAVVAVRTLAQAEARLGHWPQARAAWRAASGLGWRDLPTQYWAMRQALADHELATAGMRADALLRQDEGIGPFGVLIRQGLSDPALRAAIAQRFVLGPSWRGPLLNPGRQWTDRELAGIVPFLIDLQHSSLPPTRREVHDAILTLIAKGRYAEAIALDAPFAKQRKPDPGSLIDDGGFDLPADRYGQETTPFEWYSAIVGGSTTVLDHAGTNVMVVSANGKGDQSSLRRYVALRPGSYTLRYRIKGPANAPASVGFRLSCANLTIGESQTAELPSSNFVARSFTFNVPTDCPVVLIGLGSLASAEEVEAEFDDVRLWPASAPAAIAHQASR